MSINPTKMAAMKAPFTEPIPPIIMTTNATIMISFPMPILASVIGDIIIPASPAIAAPAPNTNVNKVLISIPRAPIIVLLEAPARISMPDLVRVITK